MIKLLVIGNLGKDATTNNVSGKSVINFSVAHTEKFTSNGEKREKTTWVECAYWTDKTGIAPYLKKGQQVYVEGTPEVRTYESNGKAGASLTVRVYSVQLLGGKQEGATQQQTEKSSYSNTADNSNDDINSTDDLPF